MSNEKKVFHDYLKVAFGENATVKEENDVNEPFNFLVDPLSPTESTFTDSHRMDHYPLADNPAEDEIVNLCRYIKVIPETYQTNPRHIEKQTQNVCNNICNNMKPKHIRPNYPTYTKHLQKTHPKNAHIYKSIQETDP